jgi:hypothetical protein
MRKVPVVIAAIGLVLCLAACEAFTTSGESIRAGHSGRAGVLEVSYRKANGSMMRNVAVDDVALKGLVSPGDILEVDLTLAVGQGSFKIELLGQDEQVTLALEARDGQTLAGHGQIVVDDSRDVPYRVTAAEAEHIDYYMEYWIP